MRRRGLAFALASSAALASWPAVASFPERPITMITGYGPGGSTDIAARLLADRVAAHLADGRLVRVLADWCPPYPGYHLYYPSRRQPTPAFALLVEALRHRG